MKARSRHLAAVAACSMVILGVTAPHGAVAAPVAPAAFTSNGLATWQTDGIVWALAQTGGTVFAGGTFNTVRPPGAAAGAPSSQPAVNFAAFDAATGNPVSCGLSFTVSDGTPTIRALAVSPDGKTLYAGGWFDHVNGTYVNNLVAIDTATCKLTTGFTPPHVNATVRTITVSADNVYVGGDFTAVDGQTREHLAEVGTDGTLSAWAPSTSGPVRASVLSPDGTKLVVGGDFYTLNGGDSHALGVLDSTSGATVRAYPLGFIEKFSAVKALTADATGFYTGNEGSGGGVFDGRIAIDWSTLDQRWRDTCLGATQAVVSYQGVLYAGSHTHDCSSMGEQPDGRRQHLIAEPTTTGMELPWAPDTNDGIGEQIGPRALTIATTANQPYLWVSGEFTTVNGTAQQGLTRFGTGPDKAPPTTPQVNVAALTSGQLAVRIRASTDTDDGTLTYHVYRDGGSTPVWTGTATSWWWSRPQLTFTDKGLTAGSKHSYKVKVTDGTNTATSATVSGTVPSADGAYDAKVAADGAKLYWRYDGAASVTFMADSSSGNQTGYFNGGGTYNDGTGAVNDDLGTPLGFNGTSGYVYDEVAQPGATSYSVETWFRTTSKSGGLLMGLGNKQVLSSTISDKDVYLSPTGQVVFGAYNVYHYALTSATGYNDGRWHHVVATQGPQGMQLYVGGKLVASNRTTVSPTRMPTGYWHAGGGVELSAWPNHGTSDYLAGDLDESAVYPVVLTAAQVAAHYAARTS